MLTASEIIEKYISFFEKRGHKRITNSPLVPENDPTTLFTSSGMQPLVPYLLGEPHPQGKRLVNVQNSFRAADIDEVGDNRHTTFFRMLGNWSLGDPARNASPAGQRLALSGRHSEAGGYFKKEQLPWFFEFLTKELGLDPKRLYVTVFKGGDNIHLDSESIKIWEELFKSVGINPIDRIFEYGAEENWWSRSGEPKNMPSGEPGGPDSEVFFDFYPEQEKIEDLKKYSHNGRLLEIGNSVFMEYKKTKNGFEKLPQKNVDFGGGLERLLAAAENKQDIFKTSLFSPIVEAIEKETNQKYDAKKTEMRIISDHLAGSVFIVNNNVKPGNKEQGYILRRLIRRAFDNTVLLQKDQELVDPVRKIIESVINAYKETDPDLVENSEVIINTILEEVNNYKFSIKKAKEYVSKKHKIDGEIMGVSKISAEDAFILYSTHGLSPTQIKSLGFEFDGQEFAKKMEDHQSLSRLGAEKKFKGGLGDTSEKTIKGHTATHLLHRALKDVLGEDINQKGSNITEDRIRFDFNYENKLTDEQIKKTEDIVNEKIKENLPVEFEIMTPGKARGIGATGLFDKKYEEQVKVYSIGAYSKEICGGPHVDFTGELKGFKIIKQENIGKGLKRLYSILLE